MQRYLRYFLLPVIAATACAAVLSVWFQPISGDLARIGAYSERDFGWTDPQPVLALRANGAGIANPEVLVLGDSFSEHNLWQSVVASQVGGGILSFRYNQSRCIRNWVRYALAQPSARYVVIESVEREFVKRFAALSQCETGQPVPFELDSGETAPMRDTWPPVLHLRYAATTALNTLELDTRGGTVHGGDVIAAPLRPGCAKFSNRRADRLLYYSDDDRKREWTAQQIDAAVANLKQIQREVAAHGKTFVFILVPDKSSTYRECLSDDSESVARKQVNPIQTLIQAGLATPDLLRVFQANANRIADLYLPDDTHLSPAGYRLMASQVAPLVTDKPGSSAGSR